jgi:hypothetical protein
MFANTLRSAFALGLGLATTLLSTGAAAAGFDGTANLVCAAVDVVGCTNGPVCAQGQAKAFDLPAFMFIDFQNQVIRATDESGYKEVSPIRNLEKTDARLILQGVENHRGWSATIDRSSGAVTVTSSGPDVSFMVFGNCTAL